MIILFLRRDSELFFSVLETAPFPCRTTNDDPSRENGESREIAGVVAYRVRAASRKNTPRTRARRGGGAKKVLADV